ncbi:hypothetical protein NQZ68_031053 [Dissostichus eleginoides]|nr:hypothetical protein NQZ68_031053 [Dissostichus eleginoides]
MDRLLTLFSHGGKRAEAPLSSQNGEQMVKLKKGSSFYEKVLEDLEKFHLGPRTGCKDRENATQASSHGLRFCLYMQPMSAPAGVLFIFPKRCSQQQRNSDPTGPSTSFRAAN